MAAKTYFVPATPSKSDPLAQHWINGWKAAHACKILDENMMCRVEHNTSKSTAA